LLDHKGEAVAYAWPGGYPVYYVAGRDCVILCPGCVTANLDQCAGPEDDQWTVIAHGANWENPALRCDHCGGRIESAYAEDDTPTTLTLIEGGLS